MSKEYLHDSIYSPWSFPLDPPEQREAEHERWQSLTKQQRHEEWLVFLEQSKERRLEEERIEQENKRKRNIEEDKWLYIHAENPNSLENSEATIIWIMVMVVSALFKDGWIMWITATIMWLSHIFRYQIRESKWEEKMKNGGERYE